MKLEFVWTPRVGGTQIFYATPLVEGRKGEKISKREIKMVSC
jgi:hypothetical protein